MNSSIFVNDPMLKPLKDLANRSDEHASKKLFLRLITRHFFSELEWVIGTEVPTRDHHDQLRMDISVQFWDQASRALAFRLIGEGKKGKATKNDIANAESQVYKYCQNYMIHHSVDSVWAMTYFGSKARLWACKLKDQHMLYPFYPFEEDHGNRDLYRDIQEFEDDFTWAFEQIKTIENPDPRKFREMYGPSDEEMHVDEGQASSVAYARLSEDVGDIEEVRVSRISDDHVTCRRENGDKIGIRSAWRAYKFGGEDGYLAETSRGNFWTRDDLKGKRKASR